MLEMSTKIYCDCDFHDIWHRESHVLLMGVNEFTFTCVQCNTDILKIKTDCKVCVLHHGVGNLQPQCRTHVVFTAIACYFAGVSPLRTQLLQPNNHCYKWNQIMIQLPAGEEHHVIAWF